MVSHGNLAHNLTAITRSLHAKEDTVVVSWLPQYHDMGLIGSHLGVMCVALGRACRGEGRGGGRGWQYALTRGGGCGRALWVCSYCGGTGVYMSPLSYIKNPPVWIKVRGCACAHAHTHARAPGVFSLAVPGMCRTQAVSVYRGTHLQAPSFAYALTVRKFKQQKRFKLQDLDLSCVRHVFNAVRHAARALLALPLRVLVLHRIS